MGLPFVEVSHLPASTSFYSSVLQPLGLQYLSADRESSSSIGTVTYGFKALALGQEKPIPVLQIREATHPLAPLKLSSLVLTAPSRSAVAEFHACALDANPWLRIQDHDDASSPAYPGSSVRPRLGIDSGLSRATIRDLDGNIMEVVYPPPSGGSRPLTYNGVPVRQTQSSRDEAVRILDWNYDVASRSARATSHHSSSTSSHPSQALSPTRPRYASSQTVPAGSVVSAAMSQRALSQHSDDAEPLPEPSISPRQSSSKSGLNTTNVVGALLGVAAGAVAGAALTYNMVNKEKERKPRHDVGQPTLARRSTYPEKAPRSTHQYDRRSAFGDYPPKALPYQQDYDYGQPRMPFPEHYPPPPLPYPNEYAPHTSPYDNYAPRTMPYQDRYAPKNMVYEDDDSDDQVTPESHRRPVQYLTQRSHHSSPSKGTTRSAPRSRVVEDEYETRDVRSHHSSTRHTSGRAPSLRTRSEAPASRAPLMLADVDRRSQTGSRHSTAPKSSHSKARSQRPHYDPERDSYFSARSQRSSATVRQPPAEEVEREVVIRSRSGSRVTNAKIAGERSYVVRQSSRAPSHVSARNIGLPMSGVGSSHANWDDDMESVAPSDSISCVGSKTSRRSRKVR